MIYGTKTPTALLQIITTTECTSDRRLSLTKSRKCGNTPWIIVRQEVDGNVMDAVDPCQVQPPGGSLCGI